MNLQRNAQGSWERLDSETANENHLYTEAFLRYLNSLDSLFMKAREASEFEFLMTLFRPRGVEDAGWDPFQSTLDGLRAVVSSHANLGGVAQRHLELWLYGHIIEASEPYEIIANLLAIVDGETFKISRFEPHRGGRDKSPGEKINQLKNLATRLKLSEICTPLLELWDKDLRNAIFHADYALYGPEVRIRKPFKEYSHLEISTLSNRAVAYFEALATIYQAHIASYKEPTLFKVPDYFSTFPTGVVLVSKDHGAVGIQAAASKEDMEDGVIVWRVGILTSTERKSLEDDQTKWLLPPREKKTSAI
jgi:hypothetical protein